MTFDKILEQAIVMLQRRGRVSYGALKRQFDLDNDYLADLKVELIEVSRKDGFIITAFIARKVNRELIVWPKRR